MALRAMGAVYSYRFPAIRRIINKVVAENGGGYPHAPFMGGLFVEKALDHFPQVVLGKATAFHAQTVPALGDFKHRYATSGSQEGIKEVATVLQTAGAERVYYFKGDYEGYLHVPESRGFVEGLNLIAVEKGTNPRDLEPGHWFISNPSAIDGNIIPNEVIVEICEAGHQVFYDLAYLDSTPPHTYDISHPNIFAVVLSLSKPYGLFYDRIGFTLSRKMIPALIGNKWFYNPFLMMIAEGIFDNLEPGELYQEYSPLQAEIIEKINQEHGLVIEASDALLLGHIKPEAARALREEQLQLVERYQRGGGYRFCLSPYFLDRDPERAEIFKEFDRGIISKVWGHLTGEEQQEVLRLRRELLGG